MSTSEPPPQAPTTRAEWVDELVPPALVAAFFFLNSVVSVRFSWEPQNVAALRLGGAVLLGVVLQRRPRRPWLYFMFSCWALIAATLLGGRPPLLALGTAVVRILEIRLAYTLVRWRRVKAVGLADPIALLRVGLYAVVLAPAVGGVFGAAFVHLTYGGSAVAGFTNWWAGNAFGMLAALPAVLAWSPERWREFKSQRVWPRFAAALLVTLLCTSLALEFLARPFVVLGLPLIIAALLLGVFETTLVCALNVIAIVLLRAADAAGLLPTPLSHHMAELGLAQVHFFSAVTVIAPLTVNLLLAQRQEALRHLVASETRLRTITDNLPALIGYLDADLRYRFNNLAYTAWTDVPREDYAGRTVGEIFGEEAARPTSEMMRRCLEGERITFERSIMNGRTVITTFVPDARDGGIHGVYTLSLDITGHRAAEEALFAERERAEVTLRSIGDGVVAVDVAGKVTYLNPVAEAMTGWALAEAQGRALGEVVRIVDTRTGGAGLNPLLLAVQENRTLGLSSDAVLVRRDGSQSPIEDSAAPMHDRAGAVVGGVMVFHDVSETRAMATKMSHLAQYDQLTDLPNRVLLQDRFAQAVVRAKREGWRLALLFIDLDGFKPVNDTLGHEAGDRLLKEVAARLKGVVRASDTVSRQGGDEFVVLLPQLAETSDAARVAEKLLNAIREPFALGTGSVNVTLSVGIALYPEDGSEPEALMKCADAAMYQSKQHGRDQYRFYTRAISERADARMSLEGSLRRALREGEFTLHYQPKVRSADGVITGMEALVRWRLPSGELVAPMDFIPVAEEIGLVPRIDLWVMEEACRQNLAWQARGLRAVPVAVNVSAACVEVEGFLGQVSAVLARTGLDPRYLQIEITESHGLKDTERLQGLIGALKELGVRVAIDDFGTGYSSLGYLSRYPFDVLKIDRTFVRDMEEGRPMAVVEAIVRMAHALGYELVAEGVETAAQAARLETMGCHELQGYLYSRPVPAEEFEKLLRRGSLPPLAD